MSDVGSNYPGGRHELMAPGQGSTERSSRPTPDGAIPVELIHKVLLRRLHAPELYLHIYSRDQKITSVRVGVDIVGSGDVYEPTERDLEHVFRYVKEKAQDGIVRLAHTPTLQGYDFDSDDLLAAIDGLMRDKNTAGKIAPTWSEKRHAQREKDVMGQGEESPVRGKGPNGGPPKRSVDDFMLSLDAVLGLDDPSPPARGPLGD